MFKTGFPAIRCTEFYIAIQGKTHIMQTDMLFFGDIL